MRRAAHLSVLFLAAVSVFGGARRRSISPTEPAVTSLNPHRSFVVTSRAVLAGFSFQRVMQAIVDRSGTSTAASALVEQMFDTQNPKPGLRAPNAPHCDDFVANDGTPLFNGLPRRCPTPESWLAAADPFDGRFVPLAVVNRFDQTPADGSNCGQYRVIFARVSPNPADRLHIIFEAVLPNPNPAAGIAACRPVAEFWAELSEIDSVPLRRAALEQFFFDGLDGFAPALDPDHLSLASGGGIRTMQNTAASAVGVRFYQFRLAKYCGSGGCDLVAEPDVLANMPFGRFFDATYDTPAARAFRDEFVARVAGLAIDDVNLYSIEVPRQFLMAESDPVDGEFEFAYGVAFRRAQSTPAGQDFAGRIEAGLKRAGSGLTPDQLIMRAETQSCVGCHILFGPVGDGVEFPRSIDTFQHVSENFVEQGPSGPRFAISPAMQNVFVPHRMEILERFLASGTPPVHSN